VGVEIDGLPFLLIDTAGIRSTPDAVEQQGVEVARRAVGTADLVLHCEPAGDADPEERAELLNLAGEVPILRVRTKSDLVGPDPQEIREVGLSSEPDVATLEVGVSALDRSGLDRLRTAMVRSVFDQTRADGVGVGEEHPVLTRDRQVEGVRTAAREVRDFALAVEGGIPPEVASAHLKSAATATEELLGTIGTEEVLDRVFSDFCIGK